MKTQSLENENKEIQEKIDGSIEDGYLKKKVRKACRLCRGIQDDYNILECGFDRDLIGSDPEKLATSYLQGSYEAQLNPYERDICFSCRKLVSNAQDKNKLIEFLLRL